MKPTPLEAAVAAADGPSRLAQLIGVTVQRLNHWHERGVPAEFCPTIESHTGVKAESLRDDLAWIRVKDKAWPGGAKPLLDVAP